MSPDSSWVWVCGGEVWWQWVLHSCQLPCTCEQTDSYPRMALHQSASSLTIPLNPVAWPEEPTPCDSQQSAAQATNGHLLHKSEAFTTFQAIHMFHPIFAWLLLQFFCQSSNSHYLRGNHSSKPWHEQDWLVQTETTAHCHRSWQTQGSVPMAEGEKRWGSTWQTKVSNYCSITSKQLQCIITIQFPWGAWRCWQQT